MCFDPVQQFQTRAAFGAWKQNSAFVANFCTQSLECPHSCQLSPISTCLCPCCQKREAERHCLLTFRGSESGTSFADSWLNLGTYPACVGKSWGELRPFCQVSRFHFLSRGFLRDDHEGSSSVAKANSRGCSERLKEPVA